MKIIMELSDRIVTGVFSRQISNEFNFTIWIWFRGNWTDKKAWIVAYMKKIDRLLETNFPMLFFYPKLPNIHFFYLNTISPKKWIDGVFLVKFWRINMILTADNRLFSSWFQKKINKYWVTKKNHTAYTFTVCFCFSFLFDNAVTICKGIGNWKKKKKTKQKNKNNWFIELVTVVEPA